MKGSADWWHRQHRDVLGLGRSGAAECLVNEEGVDAGLEIIPKLFLV